MMTRSEHTLTAQTYEDDSDESEQEHSEVNIINFQKKKAKPMSKPRNLARMDKFPCCQKKLVVTLH